MKLPGSLQQPTPAQGFQLGLVEQPELGADLEGPEDFQIDALDQQSRPRPHRPLVRRGTFIEGSQRQLGRPLETWGDAVGGVDRDDFPRSFLGVVSGDRTQVGKARVAEDRVQSIPFDGPVGQPDGALLVACLGA